MSSPQLCIECYTYGLLNSGMVLILGPPASGKTTLARSFVRLAAQNEKSIIYISTQASESEIRTQFANLEVPDGSHLEVLDCFSWSTPHLEGSKTALNPSNLSEVGIEFQSRLKKSRGAYVTIDSLDAFALDAGEDAASKFLRTMIPRLKAQMASGTATVTSGIHTPRFENVLRTTF